MVDTQNIVSFDELAEKHGNQILNLAYRLTGHYADAEDIAQEVLVKAFKNYAQFKQGTNLSAWLYKITINVYRDYRRYNTRRKTAAHVSLDEVNSNGQVQVPLANDTGNSEQILENEQQNKMLMQTLNKLETKHKVVVVLRVMEHKSYEEISEILGCPVGTVKSRMFYACETLRKMMKKSGNI
ncbi:MAG: sigma-70 family RNA polymerase sigma factor [Elusimicrobiota bacterium]